MTCDGGYLVLVYDTTTYMTAFRPRTLVLFLGDLCFFALALWVSLGLRSFSLPTITTFAEHLVPFSMLFAVWVGFFFIAGLYESRSIILARRALSETLLITQVINIAIAGLFFFLIPYFGITPKTLLFIYLAVSFLFVLFWRAFLFPWIGIERQEPAIMIAEGEEAEELAHALRVAHRAPVRIAEIVRPEADVASAASHSLVAHGARVVIADWSDPRVSAAFSGFYSYLFGGMRFFDLHDVYEEVFGRIGLSRIDNRWLARNVSRSAHLLYDPIKRFMDIAISLPGSLLPALLYPFIALAIKLEDRGPVFVLLPRVGQDGQTIYIRKFRSMTGNDAGNYGAQGSTKLSVTKVGQVLRTTRLDEFPQLWGVLRGDLSLIGPRPESPALVESYNKEIPHYALRHLVRPGLSGWAQLYHDNHPHHGTDVEATREKLSYDLYYLKHRSLWLDAVIIIKTLKKLLTRSGA